MTNYVEYITLFILTWFYGIKLLIPLYAFYAYNRYMFSCIKLTFLISWQFLGFWISLYGLLIFGMYELIYKWELIKEIIKIILPIDKLNNIVKKYVAMARDKIGHGLIYQKLILLIDFVYYLKDSSPVRCASRAIGKINACISLTLHFINKGIKKIPYTEKYFYHTLEVINEKYQKINKLLDKYNIEFNQLTGGIKSLQSMMDKLGDMEGMLGIRKMSKKISDKVVQNDNFSFNSMFNSIMDSDLSKLFNTKDNTNNDLPRQALGCKSLRDCDVPFNINSMIKSWSKGASSEKVKKQ